MGVPKQVVEMEAEGDKELDAANAPKAETPAVDTPVAKPAAPEPKTTEVVEVKPEQKADILSDLTSPEAFDKAVRDAVARKEAARDASTYGRVKKVTAEMTAQLNAQRESYEAKIADLESKLSELGKKLETVQIGNAAGVEDHDASDDELFAEIRKEYSPDDYSDEDLKRFIGVINRVGNRNAKALRRMQERFDEMDAERAERAKSAAKAEADKFIERLNADFPGFRELDSNNDPRWIGFLASSLGGVMEGTTYGDVAKAALKALDYRKFSSVVREFAKQSQIVFSPNANPGSGSVMSQVRPRNIPAQPTGSTKAQPRVVPMAEIEAFRKAAFAHRAEERYGMTHEQVMERLRFYEDAEAEGRVR